MDGVCVNVGGTWEREGVTGSVPLYSGRLEGLWDTED